MLSPLTQNAHKVPPPWLIAMQRYGPPPSYPNLKIPGLNSPIPDVWSFPLQMVLNPQSNNSPDLHTPLLVFSFLCLLELYIWLSCRGLGETSCRRNGQTSLWRRVRDQLCRFPGQMCSQFKKYTEVNRKDLMCCSLNGSFLFMVKRNITLSCYQMI